MGKLLGKYLNALHFEYPDVPRFPSFELLSKRSVNELKLIFREH